MVTHMGAVLGIYGRVWLPAWPVWEKAVICFVTVTETVPPGSDNGVNHQDFSQSGEAHNTSAQVYLRNSSSHWERRHTWRDMQLEMHSQKEVLHAKGVHSQRDSSSSLWVIHAKAGVTHDEQAQ